MKHEHTQETIIVALLISVAVLFNVFVWVGKVAQTPQGHDFIPTHNSLSDYAFYTSVIRQGMSGQFSVFDRFAVEPHEGSVIHIFYLILGWAGTLLGFTSAPAVYHTARYLLGIVWCITIYWLISVCVKEKWVRIIALFFALFSASFPQFIWTNGVLDVRWYMTWWSELDPVIRVAFIPHFLTGHIMLVTTFVSLIKYMQFRFPESSGMYRPRFRESFKTWWHTESKTGKRWIVRAVVASFIAAFVHPPSAIQILLVIPLLVVLVRSRRMLVIGMASIVSAGVGLLLINRISAIFPWNLPRIFEGWSFALSMWEYLLALGPVIVFSIIGLFTIRKNSEAILLFLWIVTSMVMIPLSLLMPFSSINMIRTHPIANIRFLQMAIWVPLSIFGAYGAWFLWRKMSVLFRLILIGAIFFLTFVGYVGTITEQVAHMYFTAEYKYPPVGYLSGIRELEDITRLDQSIMSLSLAGMTIPTYINRTVYVGQIVYTPDIDKKLAISWSFYKGSMTPCEAYTLVKNHNIGAVLYSFDEKQAGDAVKFYSFLQPWNSYGNTQIYKVVDIAPEGCAI